MAGIILSVDIGTSSLKAAFIDLDGRLLAFSRAAYRTDSNGIVDAGAWEQAFVRALEKLHGLAPDCGIDGVCISGNGPTLVPVTQEDEALSPLYWHGGKTAPLQASEAPSFFLPHAAWFRENSPDDYKRTKLFISSHEWLATRLGAEALTVLPQAAYEPYYWNDEQCRLFGLDRGKFPPFVKTGSVIGKVSAKASAFFENASGKRLKGGTPIIAGGPDFITALIGTGTLRPGDVCDRAGSSEGINLCAASPVKGDGLRVLPHAKEGLWNIGVVIPSSGRLFEKYRTGTGQEDRPYEELLAELIPSTANTDIFRKIEFFRPWRADLEGNKLPGENSSLPRSPLELGRAVLCAMGFAVRSALKTLEASGFPVKEMRVSGGQGKNPRWNQLKADITGLCIMEPEIPDGELAGNAVLAAAALENAGGPVKVSFESAAQKMIRIREVFKPENAAFWEERYMLYKEATS